MDVSIISAVIIWPAIGHVSLGLSVVSQQAIHGLSVSTKFSSMTSSEQVTAPHDTKEFKKPKATNQVRNFADVLAVKVSFRVYTRKKYKTPSY